MAVCARVLHVKRNIISLVWKRLGQSVTTGGEIIDLMRLRQDGIRRSHSIFQRKNPRVSLIAQEGVEQPKAGLDAINQNLNAVAPIIGNSCNKKKKNIKGERKSLQSIASPMHPQSAAAAVLI